MKSCSDSLNLNISQQKHTLS